MISTDVKAALTNYHEIKRAIKIDLQNLTIIRNKKMKIGGSIVKRSQNPMSRDEVIIENMDTEDRYVIELKNHQYWIFLVDEFIKSCDGEIKKIVIDLYIRKIRMDEIIDIYSYSKSQIHRRISDEVDAFVQEMNEKQI